VKNDTNIYLGVILGSCCGQRWLWEIGAFGIVCRLLREYKLRSLGVNCLNPNSLRFLKPERLSITDLINLELTIFPRIFPIPILKRCLKKHSVHLSHWKSRTESNILFSTNISAEMCSEAAIYITILLARS